MTRPFLLAFLPRKKLLLFAALLVLDFDELFERVSVLDFVLGEIADSFLVFDVFGC